MVRFKILSMMVLGVIAGTGAYAAAGPGAELATVNGRPVTLKDLQAALSTLSEPQQAQVLKDASGKRQVLNGVIDQELLVQESEKEKMDQDPAYKDALSAFRRQYLSQRLLEKNLGSKITDSVARKFYDSHKDVYSTDQVHAMHILVSDEKQAGDIFKQAKDPKSDFQALAEKYSKDPSAKNNRGDLGFFGRDRMVPEFTTPAFAGKPGDVIGPVRTAYGFHIIKVIEHKPGKPLNYEEVELRVRNELRQELIQNYVGGLKKQAKITVNEKNL